MSFEDFIKDKHIEMKSNELNDLLNGWRAEEGKGKVRHNNFKSKIETELKTLQSLNHKGVLNFK